jgi:hypothetical protein
VTVSTTDAENRRWVVLDDYYGRPGTQVEPGQVTFRIRQRDIEGMNNVITVRVGSSWKEKWWESGKINDMRSSLSEIRIRVVLGPRDKRPL